MTIKIVMEFRLKLSDHSVRLKIRSNYEKENYFCNFAFRSVLYC